jgi:hypothetical protein
VARCGYRGYSVATGGARLHGVRHRAHETRSAVRGRMRGVREWPRVCRERVTAAGSKQRVQTAHHLVQRRVELVRHREQQLLLQLFELAHTAVEQRCARRACSTPLTRYAVAATCVMLRVRAAQEVHAPTVLSTCACVCERCMTARPNRRAGENTQHHARATHAAPGSHVAMHVMHAAAAPVDAIAATATQYSPRTRHPQCSGNEHAAATAMVVPCMRAMRPSIVLWSL